MHVPFILIAMKVAFRDKRSLRKTAVHPGILFLKNHNFGHFLLSVYLYSDCIGFNIV